MADWQIDLTKKGGRKVENQRRGLPALRGGFYTSKWAAQ
jgi:hypothetical protein